MRCGGALGASAAACPLPGADDAGRTRQAEPQDGCRDDDQALEILGLEAGATSAQIHAAYIRLMQRVHPDRGGTNFLAKQLSDARDALLGHRAR